MKELILVGRHLNEYEIAWEKHFAKNAQTDLKKLHHSGYRIERVTSTQVSCIGQEGKRVYFAEDPQSDPRKWKSFQRLAENIIASQASST